MEHTQSFLMLEPYLKKLRRCKHVDSILYYDLATLCGEEGISDEGELMDYLAGEEAKIYSDPGFVKAVESGLKEEKAPPMEKRLFSSLYNQVALLRKMPLEEYLSYRNAISKSNEMWRKYRPANDFKSWLPYWQHLVDISRVVADYQHKDGMKSRYDSCLDSYEPGESEAMLDSIFNPLKEKLIPLLKKAKEKQKGYSLPEIKPYPVDKQEQMGRKMLDLIGYDMKGGCLMVSAHPFSNDNHQHDARLTTKYLVNDWRSNVFTCLHEGGHCLEFQNKPQNLYDGYSESLATAAICETHSRFYENIIGRSKEFMPYMKKAAEETLDPGFSYMNEEDFYHLVNKIEPWLIRCEADELSYCLHIIVRYEIEKELINGTIECKDVPALWKKKYKDYLDVDVPNDKDGCMQDTHWSEALWGYFPSYALGNLYGAMIKEQMEKDIGFASLIEKGEFKKILAYLAEKDFAYDYLSPDDWIMKITGKHLSSEAYIRYLEKKFD
ncbi:MAG: carboxypeptidase M32 [Bacilli bacterium]|nr:carboxypeptidase M32 [Bacilli bacterium]